MVNQQPPPLNFEAIEHQQNLNNLAEMAEEIAQRSDRLRTRILHFARQFDIPEADFWRDLNANPNGPLAAVLTREARRQNIHERAAADYVAALPHVAQFRKLPSSGPNACYVNANGQIFTGEQLGGAPRPSKSIDFQWQQVRSPATQPRNTQEKEVVIKITSSTRFKRCCKISYCVSITALRSLFWWTVHITQKPGSVICMV